MNDNWKKIVNDLKKKEITISTMESCTGGGIANEITNISGASEVFKEGFVTYSNEAKIKHGVPEVLIEQYTVYSPEVAVGMAKAAKELGDKKLCRMLVCLAHDEVCHRHKIKSYLEEHEVPLTIDNEEEEQAEFLMFQLKKL